MRLKVPKIGNGRCESIHFNSTVVRLKDKIQLDLDKMALFQFNCCAIKGATSALAVQLSSISIQLLCD